MDNLAAYYGGQRGHGPHFLYFLQSWIFAIQINPIKPLWPPQT